MTPALYPPFMAILGQMNIVKKSGTSELHGY